MKIQSKVQILEERTKEAERTAELAEADAREKDKELVETLKRLKDYESVCIFILSIKKLNYSCYLQLDCSVPCTVYYLKTFQKYLMIKIILTSLCENVQTFASLLLFGRRIVFKPFD